MEQTTAPPQDYLICHTLIYMKPEDGIDNNGEEPHQQNIENSNTDIGILFVLVRPHPFGPVLEDRANNQGYE